MRQGAASPAPSFKAWLWLAWLAMALPAWAQEAPSCGELQTVEVRPGREMRYSHLSAAAEAPAAQRITLLLLIGGGGTLRLDERACPQSLRHNVLVRARALWQAAGIATALVDAPSDHLQAEDGLAGLRTSVEHAEDLGVLIARLRRQQGGGAVWVIGHSRGSLSAINAAVRLDGPAAPDGVVLASPMVSGETGRKKPWVAQTVFDLPLESLRLPLLVITHAAESCPRSLPQRMPEILARTPPGRRQLAVQEGGPVAPGRAPSLAACEVREPHDFVAQEREFAAGVARFVRGEDY